MVKEKKCTGCQEVKLAEYFSKWSRRADGLQNYCKECNKKYLKKFNPTYLPERRNGDPSKSGSLLNAVWHHMKSRCTNPDDSHYESYGGRGITVCDKWLTWEGFLEDMLDGYTKGLSLERKDVNLGYSKDNCCWIPLPDQAFNKQDSIYITHPSRGQIRLTEHSRELGFNARTVYARYREYGDNYEKLYAEYLPKSSEYPKEVKLYIAETFGTPTKDIICEVERRFGIILSPQYIRQTRSDWKTGSKSSCLTKLIGPYDEWVSGKTTLTITSYDTADSVDGWDDL